MAEAIRDTRNADGAYRGIRSQNYRKEIDPLYTIFNYAKKPKEHKKLAVIG